MPYRRSYRRTYRSTRYRRPTRYQRNTGTSQLIPKAFGSAYSIAKKALSIGMSLKGLVNSEKKYFDSNSTDFVSWNGTVNPLSNIAQGNDVGNRDGNSILARSLWLQMDVRGNVANQSNIVRVIVFVDTENTGSTPAASDVLQTTGSAFAVDSPLNVDHLPRYTILMDKKFVTSTAGQTRLNTKRYINLYKHIKYTGPNATDTYKNQLFILFVSDVITDDPILTYYSRLGFMDN